MDVEAEGVGAQGFCVGRRLGDDVEQAGIVVRGKDAQGADLVIARDYLTKGLRARAEEGLTQELGPRRDVEIAEARYREVSQDRFTSLDRELAKLSVEGHVELPARAGSGGRFMRSLYQQRLSYLETLHLAQPSGTGRWRLKEGWDRALQAMGRRGDIVRGLAAGLERIILEFSGATAERDRAVKAVRTQN